MPIKSKKLFLVGDSQFAQIACEYFQADSEYDVMGFAVEREYLKTSELFGLPVVALEDASQHFSAADHHVFVAITYGQLNRLRSRLVASVQNLGYSLASYISSKAFVWKNVAIGRHSFIFEDNTVQPFCQIGENVILWSGNHIGHHSTIQDNCFISSHVVISGGCVIGENSFLGVNSTVANNVTIGKDNWIGPGIVIARDTPTGSLFHLPAIEPSKVSALRFFKVK